MADYQMSGKNYWNLFGRKLKQLKENSEHFNPNPKPRLPGGGEDMDLPLHGHSCHGETGYH